MGVDGGEQNGKAQRGVLYFFCTANNLEMAYAFSGQFGSMEWLWQLVPLQMALALPLTSMG